MELGQNRKSKQVKRIDVKQPEKREEDNSEKDSDRQSTENMHTISDSVQSIEYLLFINRKNHSTFPYTTTFRLYHWATARWFLNTVDRLYLKIVTFVTNNRGLSWIFLTALRQILYKKLFF